MAERSPADLFRAIAEFTYDWETWVDVDGTPKWVNEAVERITGYSVAECLAMPSYPLPLAHESDRGLLARVREEAAKGGSGNDVEFRVVRKDGSTRWVAMSWQAVRARDGEALGYRTSVRDIDERKRMEQELHVMRRRAEAAAIARAELLANVSHELRSPVHCIAGFSELLLSGALDAGPRRYAEIIHDQCQSMLQQVEDLLELAALEAGGVRILRESFDLQGLMARLAEGEAPEAARRGITLTCETSSAPAWVEGDAQRLGQVLRNLLDNALKFTEQGGVTLAAWADGDDVTFEVRDTGIGMEPSQVERMFEPFQQGDASAARKRGGAGLGLAICQRLVGAMGGRLSLSTAQGQGTTARVSLPLPRSEPRPAPQRPVQVSGTRGRALVVDDSAAGRELLVEMLSLQGWTALEADSGEAALRVLAEQHVDLVLLDYQMPGTDGAETAVALRRLLAARQAGARVPIVLLTANVFVREQLAEAPGAIDAIVQKPLSRASLASLLQKSGGLVPAPALLDEEVLEDLVNTLGRDGKPLLARVLPRVDDELRESLLALRGAPDRDAAGRAAHAIAGQAAIVGARALADEARALELRLESDSVDLESSARTLDAAWGKARALLFARLS